MNLESKRLKKIIIYVSILFFLFQLFYFFSFKLRKLDTIPIGVETIIIFIFLVSFFYREITAIKKYPQISYTFWVAIGIIIYLGGTFFFNILANHLDPSEIIDYWYLSYLADIIKNIFFSIGLLIYARQPKEVEDKKPTVPFLDII
ncbi:MAG: hypothetical protein J0L56_19400 [Chitinophagales bacterium]|nr:hypothetical protein [Chitinophagales bacterium]